MRSSLPLACAAVLIAAVASRAAAQPPPQPPQAPPQPRDFPAHQRTLADPAVIERGAALYGVHCRLCHGPDLRGGDLGGVNLLRSQLVLNDQDGEQIGPVVSQGRMNPGAPPMPPIALPADDVKAIASFIHSVLAKAARQGGPPPGPPIELNILVGDAAAGERYFTANCASCHSTTGDLQGLAKRYPEPMRLQNTWVGGRAQGRGGFGGFGGPAFGGPEEAPRQAKPVTVTVTMPDGKRSEGRLERIDDFIVVLTQADGTRRSFRRAGAVPKVEINDPLAGHKQLLVKYTDKDIHDVTAYLVTLK
jgi:cytochrome c oxidase cbb3-type subunit 3